MFFGYPNGDWADGGGPWSRSVDGRIDSVNIFHRRCTAPLGEAFQAVAAVIGIAH
jgi:hypothetical protein